MAYELAKNFAVSTVATAPSPATSGTSLVVASGEGTRFGSAPFNAYVVPANARPTPDNSEVVRVTNISTDTFTITRTQESSSARSIQVGDLIFIGPTAKTFTDIDARSPTAAQKNALAGTAGTPDTGNEYATKQTTDFIGTAITGFSNLPNAKGDLYGATGDNAAARVPAGSDGTVPIYDSGQSVGITSGVPLAAVKHKVLVATTVGLLPAGQSAGNYGFNLSNAAGTSVGSTAQGVFVVDATNDWTISGRTPKFVTRLLVGTNGTAPAITFTAGLSLLNAPSGGANALTYAWASQTSGTTAAVASPSANSWTTTTSSQYSLPSDGNYILTVLTSGALAATNPRAVVHAFVYAIYT